MHSVATEETQTTAARFPHGAITCPICKRPMRVASRSWLLRCASCSALRSTLTPQIDVPRSTLDESRRAAALRELRQRNFARILDRIAPLVSWRDARLLDVGCAHGWFLEAASKRGFDTFGIEPDPTTCRIARAEGHRVWNGFFPDAVPSSEKFHVISFNDVLEHLPDVGHALQESALRLHPGGLLVVNMPSSNGAFYRIASLLDRLGWPAPLDRMWQRSFPSPHLTYLTPPLTAALATQYGFTEVARNRLATLEMSGLWARLKYDGHRSPMSNALIYGAVAAAGPLFQFLPADIYLQVFRSDVARQP